MTVMDPQLDMTRRALEASRMDAPLSKNELAISYLRRIHWWIRLFGVVWVTGLIFAVSFGVVATIIAFSRTGV